MIRRMKLICCLTIAAAFFAADVCRPANAQLILDMSLLRCDDYLNADPDRQELIAAWMSGYYNAAKNQPMVDLKRFSNNKKRVSNYCRKHKTDNLMNAIQKVAY